MKTHKNTATNSLTSTFRTYKKYSYIYTIRPDCLNIKIELTITGNGKVLSRFICKEQNFPLVKISSKELFERRADFAHAGFVLKIKRSLYYTEIPQDLKLTAQTFNIEGFSDIQTCNHVCSKNCKRLSAAEDSEGGCAKVRDVPISLLLKGYCNSISDCIDISERIEKYNYVELGFESFNTTTADVTYILLCRNYRPAKRKINY